MKTRIAFSLALLALFALAASCSLTGPQGSASLALAVTVPPLHGGAASASRVVAAGTARISLTLSAPGQADILLEREVPEGGGTINLELTQLMPGAERRVLIVARALDGSDLTTGEASGISLSAGQTTSVSITMRPASSVDIPVSATPSTSFTRSASKTVFLKVQPPLAARLAVQGDLLEFRDIRFYDAEGRPYAEADTDPMSDRFGHFRSLTDNQVIYIAVPPSSADTSVQAGVVLDMAAMSTADFFMLDDKRYVPGGEDLRFDFEIPLDSGFTASASATDLFSIPTLSYGADQRSLSILSSSIMMNVDDDSISLIVRDAYPGVGAEHVLDFSGVSSRTIHFYVNQAGTGTGTRADPLRQDNLIDLTSGELPGDTWHVFATSAQPYDLGTGSIMFTGSGVLLAGGYSEDFSPLTNNPYDTTFLFRASGSSGRLEFFSSLEARLKRICFELE